MKTVPESRSDRCNRCKIYKFMIFLGTRATRQNFYKPRQKKNAYRGKIHCLACRSSPPLWHAHLSSDPTHWGSLISYPVYGHISTWLALIETSRHYTRSELLVGHIFNPWHSSIVDIGLVTGIDVIDSNLHLDGFVGVEHKWSETNNLTVRVS